MGRHKGRFFLSYPGVSRYPAIYYRGATHSRGADETSPEQTGIAPLRITRENFEGYLTTRLKMRSELDARDKELERIFLELFRTRLGGLM